MLWHSEKDIDEVLQTDRVFVNVGQGEFAKDADMHEAFGTTKETEVCLEVRLCRQRTAVV